MSDMLTWNEKKINGIETNPRDCYWAVDKIRDTDATARLYVIVEQRPCDTKGMVQSDEPELYVLFECLGGEPWSKTVETDKDFDRIKNWEIFGDWRFKNRGSYVHAYKTLQEAKDRAETQLNRIREICEEDFPEE